LIYPYGDEFCQSRRRLFYQRELAERALNTAVATFSVSRT